MEHVAGMGMCMGCLLFSCKRLESFLRFRFCVEDGYDDQRADGQ